MLEATALETFHKSWPPSSLEGLVVRMTVINCVSGSAQATVPVAPECPNVFSEHPVLPDLRNLGTILRVLFAVNGAALVVAFAREQRWNAIVDQWVALTSVVEPYLLAELAVLAMAAPRLVRLPYRYGVAAIVVVTVVVGIALHQFYDRLLPGQAGSLPPYTARRKGCARS